MVKAQEWLDNNYSTKSEKRIEGTKKSLEGELILSDFPNLNKVFLNGNKITKLVFINCPNVKEVNVYDNQITELEVSSLEQLEYLHCGNNKLNELDVSKNVWLKVLLYFPLENLIGVEKLVKIKWIHGKNVVKQINNVHERKFEQLQGLFNGLRIASSNKDHELERQERKIKELKELLGKSKEEIIDYKLKAKEGRLETLIEKLGIDRTRVRELQKFFQQLIRARMSDDQGEIETAEDKIETVKDNLIEEQGIDVVDIQKLCHKCEKIAKLRAEQDKLHQERFEAKQEVVLPSLRSIWGRIYGGG